MRRTLLVASLALLVAASARPALADDSLYVGVSSVRAQLFVNLDIGPFLSEAQDQMAHAVAAGDFNGDGADDLVIGIPTDDGFDLAPCLDCGGVVVRYGIVGAGVDAALPTVFLSGQIGGAPVPATPSDELGTSLVAGDFNGDGIDDLAIGIPGKAGARGAVAIHYGLPTGIQPVPEHFLEPGVGGVPGTTFANQRFGETLAVGDFDGDDFDDLAVGAPRGRVIAGAEVGVVAVLHGGVGGLLPISGYRITQDEISIPDLAEVDDRFGGALAACDVNGDGFDELVTGVSGEDLKVGAFLTLFGSEFGLLFNVNRWYGQGDVGVPGGPEAGDQFGAAVACADFDGDGYDDIAVGAPFEDQPTVGGPPVLDAGSVTTIPGDPVLGLDALHAATFDQSDDNEAVDLFGATLAAGDFDADGHDDLAVGHFGEEVGAGHDAGAVTVLLGQGHRVGLGEHRRSFFQGLEGLPGPDLQPSARFFGFSLAVGDFDGNGHDDLAIGAPHEDVAGLANAGAATVLYGSLFSDGFGTQDLTRWSVAAP